VNQRNEELYIQWVKLKAKTDIELFLGIYLIDHLGLKNFQLDLLDLNFAWIQWLGQEYLDKYVATEDREEFLAISEKRLKNGSHPKCTRKPFVKALKQLQKKGVIEVLSSKSWYQYQVNIHNPLLK
jgi:hypothetical protein